MSGGSFGAIWGSSPADMWACGTNGRVFHLEGNDWQRVPAPLPTLGIHFSRIEGIAANDIYMIGIRDDVIDPIDSTFYYLYRYDGHSWQVIDSTYWGWADGHLPHFGTRIEVIGGELYSAYRGVFKLQDNEWAKIHDDIDLSRVAGSSTKNIYASGLNGKIYHYNGADWHKLNPVPGFKGYIAGIWTDGTEAFVIADGFDKTYIFHGK